MVSQSRRLAMRRAHTKHAYFCTCGMVVRGNGARHSHAQMHRRQTDGHHYITQDAWEEQRRSAPPPPIDRNKAELAKVLAYHCVRNTALEDIHAEGRISDAEMKALMIEVTDRLYTAFTRKDVLLSPAPSYYQDPKLSPDLLPRGATGV